MAAGNLRQLTKKRSFMVTIRLARGGSKKRPFYHIHVTDSRRARDSRYIERIGFFNPVARGQEERLRVDVERVQHWVDLGAGMSDRVSKLMKEASAVAA
jgi:small subunit ribosomal protein S16